MVKHHTLAIANRERVSNVGPQTIVVIIQLGINVTATFPSRSVFLFLA
jgi:hypothetical protein